MNEGDSPWTPEFCAARLKVMAEPNRLAVLCRLLEGECKVSELNAELKLEQSLLSHHLRVLRESGLVEAARAGRWVVYRLHPDLRRGGSKTMLELGCCTVSFEG